MITQTGTEGISVDSGLIFGSAPYTTNSAISFIVMLNIKNKKLEDVD